MLILKLSTVLLFVSALYSEAAQKRTASECAAIRQFNTYERNLNRGVKESELEKECPTGKPVRKKVSKNK